MVTQVIILGILLFLSAFFSATETAFTSLGQIRIRTMAQKRGRRGKKVKELSEKPEVLLTTILIGNNLANIGASAIVTLITEDIWGKGAVSLSSGLLTLFILIFGEVTPKRLAIIHKETLALNTAYLIAVMEFLMRPVVWLISRFSTLITRLFSKGSRSGMSLDSIMHVIKMGEDTGVVKGYESRMVKSVFRLDDLPVTTIMTHRTKVFSLDMDRRVEDVIHEVNENGFSRIPVYDDHPEKIEGIVLVKEMLKALSAGKGNTKLKEIMTTPYFISESRKVNEVFVRFKRGKLKMAIVMDEYGGLAGLITLEDIMEEIFGEIYDESDIKGTDKITKTGEQQHRITGDTSLHQIRDVLGISFPEGLFSQTLGGYLVTYLDKIPKTGEQVEFKNCTIIIEATEKNRVVSVLLMEKKHHHESDEDGR